MTTKQALYAARYWASESGMKQLTASQAARLRFRECEPFDPTITHRMVWNPRYQPLPPSKDDSRSEPKDEDC